MSWEVTQQIVICQYFDFYTPLSEQFKIIFFLIMKTADYIPKGSSPVLKVPSSPYAMAGWDLKNCSHASRLKYN